MTFRITQYLPAKRKQSPSGWISFNSVCCHHRGERQDKRGRGGILTETDGSFRYNCFNCGFTASYNPTESLSRNARSLLKWLGVDSDTIDHLGLLCLKNRNILEKIKPSKPRFKPDFELVALPVGAEMLDSSVPEHSRYVTYLRSRGVKDVSGYYATPRGLGRNRNRIIVPFTYENRLVGYTSRFFDDRVPKYIHHHPTGYVFGIDHQERDWRYVIVVEGVFDAILCGGVAVLHNTISDYQSDIIQSLNKEVIVVPDKDKAGIKMIGRAIELGWGVSFPSWDSDIKDTADAVTRYGKLTTLISIIESVERSSLKIELRSKHNYAE
jgi:hypothetical protein